MSPPAKPKLFHIVHVDRLRSIAQDGFLWSDNIVHDRGSPGTAVGMSTIKHRRLTQNQLATHPGLYVGQCVPFYFCPRSIMLYVIRQANHAELHYKGGQEPIVHLVFDLHKLVAWAEANQLRWAFTLSNAGSNYFEDRSDLKKLHEVNWTAVAASDFRPKDIKEGKQAEFLVEKKVPWNLLEAIGVFSLQVRSKVHESIPDEESYPPVQIKRNWYY